VGLTFGELDERSDRVAAGLSELGVGRGDRVATLATNRIEVVELFFAVAKLGAIQVPLNAFLKGEFLRYQLDRSAAVALIADADGLRSVRPLLAGVSALRHVVALDERASAECAATAVFSELYLSATPPESSPRPEDTMSIIFTSGTTGLPKGCVVSHGYYVRSGRLTGQALGLNANDTIYCALPLFHAGGRLLALTNALVHGIPVSVDSAFSASRFFERARRVHATVAIGVGAMGQALMATPPGPGDRDHSVRTMLVSPMPVSVQEKFQERFGIDPWTEFYGQTECVPLTLTPRSAERDRAGCGLPAPDVEVGLLDELGDAVPHGEVGEVCIRPRSRFAMFDGYLDDPAQTLEAFRGLWYHTGDTARRRDSGELEFVDRKKDSMRRRGENVSSMELEAAIIRHDGVAEVAVHGVPSAQTEDDIKACIVPMQGVSLEPAELFEFFRVNLPYFAVPRYVEMYDELPKNAVGRVMKHVLRERGNGSSTIDFEGLGMAVARADRRDGGQSPR
jgi:crotonobetaine/carnitine-CoA ligase